MPWWPKGLAYQCVCVCVITEVQNLKFTNSISVKKQVNAKNIISEYLNIEKNVNRLYLPATMGLAPTLYTYSCETFGFRTLSNTNTFP